MAYIPFEDVFSIPNPRSAYQFQAGEAILKALGVTVNVSVGTKPGEVIIDFCKVPAKLAGSVLMYLNSPTIKPLTDRIVVNFLDVQL